MKTVRFTQVVAKCGHPDTHLLLTEPKHDRPLQTAIKARRVMTLMQASVGTKSDWGEEGFHPGTHRQYLVFPKSLAAYAGKAVIGIKYEMLSGAEAPRRRHATPARKPLKKSPAPAKPHKPDKPAKPEKPAKPAPQAEKKIVPFEPPPEIETKESPEVATLKRQVKRAMQALEKGKQVAAFNLLRKIVDD